jgi:hypothetical protein
MVDKKLIARAPDVLADAMLEEKVGQGHQHLVASDAPGDDDRQALARVLIGDAERLRGTAVVGLFGHEVVGPDVVSMLGPQADAGSIGEPEAAAPRLPGRDLEALSPPDALHALGVHVPAGHLQEAGDALVAVAAKAARQTDHGRGQGVLVVSGASTMTFAGAMLAEGPALRDVQPLADRRDALAAA